MKQPKLSQAFFATSLTLAFALAPLSYAKAELVSEEVQEDTITPESSNSALESEVVILKKKKTALPAAKKKVVVREEEDLPLMEPSYEPVAVQAQAQAQAQAQSQAQVQAAPARQSVGTSLDQGIQNKMSDVQVQFENALLKTLDRIKITVDDGSEAQAQAQAQAEAQAQAQSAAASPVTIVQDSVVNAQGAPGYLSVDASADAEDEMAAGESVAEKEEESFASKIRIAPIGGITTINSDFYDIDSRYTAGINLEMDVSDNLAVVLGYSYSQYDIGLGASNPYMGYYNPNFYYGNTQKLQYNQNVFDAGLRLYLLPQASKFRAFVGAGLGYNKGYLNYKNNAYTWASNPYNMNQKDYEVSSYLGILEAGAELSVAKNVSIGALFKYANVLSSSENDQLNNYAFINNGYGSSVSQDQRIVGGSIAENSFYSILGTVKVSF